MGHHSWPTLRHATRRRKLARLMGDLEPELDNCQRCLGIYGGVRGNENVIDGRVLCDYCSVEIIGHDAQSDEIRCPDCERPISGHLLITIEELENLWENGSNAAICGGEPTEYPSPGTRILVSEETPDNPCDDDFMKAISS